MNIVSTCCHREVVASTKLHYPFGGRTWREVFKVDICIGCGREVEDYAYACDECGDVGCTDHTREGREYLKQMGG